MKNVVFDLGGVVVDWSPERLMEEYTGDRAMPVSLFERGFSGNLARLRPGDDRSGEYRSGNECFFGTSLCRMLGFCRIYQTFVAGYSPNTMSD